MSGARSSIVFDLAIGSWWSGILLAAVRFDVFRLLAAEPASGAELATRLGIDVRAAQGLLDGLLGLGLVELEDGAYRPGEDAAEYLTGKSMDDLRELVLLSAGDHGLWPHLPKAVASGGPLLDKPVPSEDLAWGPLVTGIAPLALAAARQSAASLAIEERGAFHLLDLGGGAGAFSAVWLSLNPAARARQIDRARVNERARAYVAGFGVAERFETEDGDLHAVDLGEERYDFAVLSLVSHFYGAADNQALLSRIQRALRPGGTLVLADMLREAPALWASLTSASMLMVTRDGACHGLDDYRTWLHACGFAAPRIETLPDVPHTLLYAARSG